MKAGGQMLVVAEAEVSGDVIGNLLERYGKPGQITWVSKRSVPAGLDVEVKEAGSISEAGNAAYDDVIYFGSRAETVEELFSKVGAQGLFDIVLCGGKLGRDVVTPVGRVHYGGIRIVGTVGTNPAESMEYIPETGEIREGDKINVIGAGGPMGTMHVIRNICQGVTGVSIFAGDIDDSRLAIVTKIAVPLAEKNNAAYKSYNPTKDKVEEAFDYVALMAPIPGLVAASVRDAAKGGTINIFAGIPATVTGGIDLDSYIEKQLYFIGTSGSVLEDMKEVLSKVESGKLDTNISVAAVCGLDSAAEGIRAVEKHLIAGKIVVYPSCKGLGLVPLEELSGDMPEVAGCLNDGLWTREAEQRLLEKYR